MIEEISKLTKRIEHNNYNKNKLGIFNYDTLDEAKEGAERMSSDITVEIGGPRAHIKLYIATREEHTLIKNVVEKIISNREEKWTEELKIVCKKFT